MSSSSPCLRISLPPPCPTPLPHLLSARLRVTASADSAADNLLVRCGGGWPESCREFELACGPSAVREWLASAAPSSSSSSSALSDHSVPDDDHDDAAVPADSSCTHLPVRRVFPAPSAPSSASAVVVAYSFDVEATSPSPSSPPSPSPLVPRHWTLEARREGGFWRVLDERRLTADHRLAPRPEAGPPLDPDPVRHRPGWVAFLRPTSLSPTHDEFRVVVRDVFGSEGGHSKRIGGLVRVVRVRLWASSSPAGALCAPTPVCAWGWSLLQWGPACQRRLRLVSSDGALDCMTRRTFPADWEHTIAVRLAEVEGAGGGGGEEEGMRGGRQSMRASLDLDGAPLDLVPLADLLRQRDVALPTRFVSFSAPSSRLVLSTTEVLIGGAAAEEEEEGDGRQRPQLPPSQTLLPAWQLFRDARSASTASPLRSPGVDVPSSSPLGPFGFTGSVAELCVDYSQAPSPTPPLPLPPPLPSSPRTRAQPLHTLEHVLAWEPPPADDDACGGDAAVRCCEPFRSRFRGPLPSLSPTAPALGCAAACGRADRGSGSGPIQPLVLVCHDCGPAVYVEDARVGGEWRSAGTGAADPPSSSSSSLPTSSPSPAARPSPSPPLAMRVCPSGPSPSSPPTGHAYRFEHWAGTDLFVYFSHARVSLPPPGWTAAAHRNGVRVLGTLITEWADGEAANDLLIAAYAEEGGKAGGDDVRLSSGAVTLASRLAALARAFGFDGWLVNIEAPVEDARAAGRMRAFLADLTRATHAAVPDGGGVVVWYDSLDALSGRVAWQSALTPSVQPFLDVCDGVFLDYHWNEEMLARTAESAAALGRAADVFVGVDMWGRGTFGGGGWGTGTAVRAIAGARARGGETPLSVALFGPAWTYEACGGSSGPRTFRRLERRLWCGEGEGEGEGKGGAPRRLVLPVLNPAGLRADAAIRAALNGDKGAIEAVELAGWTVDASPGQGWAVEEDEEWGTGPREGDEDGSPTGDELESGTATAAATCFVTSHEWCWASQVVPLALPEGVPAGSAVTVTVSEWVRGTGPNCEDLYRLRATLLDAGREPLLETPQWDSGEIVCGRDWRRVSHSFVGVRVGGGAVGTGTGTGTAASFLRVEHAGKDAEFWAGHFGARMCGLKVVVVVAAAAAAGVASADGEANLLATSGPRGGGRGLLPLLGGPRPACGLLPFSTTFDTGLGAALYERGVKVRDGPWSDLARVQPLPHLRSLWGSPSALVVDGPAWDGGTALVLDLVQLGAREEKSAGSATTSSSSSSAAFFEIDLDAGVGAGKGVAVAVVHRWEKGDGPGGGARLLFPFLRADEGMQLVADGACEYADLGAGWQEARQKYRAAAAAAGARLRALVLCVEGKGMGPRGGGDWGAVRVGKVEVVSWE
jgi:mannosyl-glycoprotein endo-beta-N-acetylglucosaminidase